MLFIRLITVVVAIFLVSSCATIDEKMRSHIQEGKYSEAVEAGEKFITKKPSAPEIPKVRSLLMEAEFNIAKKINTIDRYDAYDHKYPVHPYKKELMTAEFALYKGINTVSGYDSYNQKFPDHPYAKELIEAEYGIYQTTDTIEGYDEFEKKFPDHPFKQDLMERKAKVYYQTVTLPRGTSEAFKDFRNRFPSSSLVKEASGKENQAALNEAEEGWKTASEKDTIEGYESFSSAFTYSTHVSEAREKICGIAFKDAENQNTIEAYQKFQKAYPNCSSLIKTANEKESELAWKQAETDNGWEAYKKFYEFYPKSIHADEAQMREKNIYEFSGPSRPEELEASVITLNDKNPNNINIFVKVTNDEKEPVGGLPKENFTVSENGCPVKIADFYGMESEVPVDIVFVFDTTGSMALQIAGVKNAAIQFAENLRLRSRNARLALVTFGDEAREVHDFTGDIKIFERWIGKQKAYGGGDPPENPLTAMVDAFKLSYRAKAQLVFVLITDAPCHESDSITKYTIREIAKKIKEKNINLFTIAPDSDQYKELTDIAGGSLYTITDYPDFSNLIEQISTLTAKQYLIVYNGTECGSKSIQRKVRVRARKNCMWIQSAPLKSNDIVDLVTSNDKSSIIYAVTGDSGIYRSNDEGMKWTRVGDNLPEKAFDKIYSIDSGSVLALSKTGKLYSSKDGQSWDVVARQPASFPEVVQNPSNQKQFTASDGRSIFTSMDGGVSWSEGKPVFEKSTPFNLVYDPTRKDTLMMLCAGEEVKISTDGGVEWKSGKMAVPEASANLSDYRLYMDPQWKEYYFMMRPDGNLYRSSDNGMTWADITPKSSGTNPRIMCRNFRFDPTKRHWLMLTTSNGVMGSNDNGMTWFTMGDGIREADLKTSVLGLSKNGNIRMCGKKSGNMYTLNPIADREFISGNVYFAKGSTSINGNLVGYLNELSVYLEKHSSARIIIDGYTDDVGKDEFNQRLSEERAESVRAYLAKRGISPDRIRTIGHGKNNPLVPNTNEKNRARNRRVELTLLGQWKG